MKERLKATCLMVQLNRKSEYQSDDDEKAVNYVRAFVPHQFQEIIDNANTYTTYLPVAIWKIKLKKEIDIIELIKNN